MLKPHFKEPLMKVYPNLTIHTVDFTSHGTPMAVAAGNLWFVCSIGCNINVANRTNHIFPNVTPTGVPCEVKSTVHISGPRKFYTVIAALWEWGVMG